MEPPDGVLIDITGCAHLFGGEAGLKQLLRARLPGAQLAIANTAAAAWGLARFGEDETENLAPLPLAALNLAERVIIKLRRVGVRRVGELMRLPRAELTAGYGKETVLKLSQALGQAPEVLRFIATPPEWLETEHHAEPISAPAQLQACLDRLIGRLCVRLADAQRGATLLTAKFYRIDRQCPAFTLRFAAPCREEFQMIKLSREKLGTDIDPGFGVEAISVEAGATEPLAPVQRSMAQDAPDYARPINTLLNRLGEKLWRAVPHHSFIPELSVQRAGLAAPKPVWEKPLHPRPLRLLPRPERINAIAPVPDDPPVFFSWRGQAHRIAGATGPERIAREWWCHAHDNTRPEAEHIRDYYEVEDIAGARFWVFRAGMHDGMRPPRWYLHGLFG